MGENNSGSTPSQGDLEDWADAFGLTIPVVADPGFNTMWDLGGNGNLPFMVLFDRGVVVDMAGNFVEESDIQRLLRD